MRRHRRDDRRYRDQVNRTWESDQREKRYKFTDRALAMLDRSRRLKKMQDELSKRRRDPVRDDPFKRRDRFRMRDQKRRRHLERALHMGLQKMRPRIFPDLAPPRIIDDAIKITKHLVCKRRHDRRKALFKLKIVGKGKGGSGRRNNWDDTSRIHC